MVSFSQAANGWFEAKVNKINRQTIKALETNMKDGEEITQTFIATRGTPGTGKQGRVDTGLMLESVESETQAMGPDEVIGRFGWIDKKPFYAEYQEAGTPYIPPMYALQDAGDIIKRQLVKDISDAVKDA